MAATTNGATLDEAARDPWWLHLLRRILARHERLIESSSSMGAVWPVDALAGVADLAAAWQEVLADLRTLELAEHDGLDVERLAGMALGVSGRWEFHYLVLDGVVIDAAARHCARTLELLDGVPGLRGACFSVQGPGTHLAPHRGPNKSILRVHVALRVPGAGASGLVVDGQTIDHEEGRALVFDDTFVHEAFNRGDSDRVTLMLDVRRPLPGWLRPIDRAVQSLYRLHPVERRAGRRMVELEAALNG